MGTKERPMTTKLNPRTGVRALFSCAPGLGHFYPMLPLGTIFGSPALFSAALAGRAGRQRARHGWSAR